jgi:hypothetical protein
VSENQETCWVYTAAEKRAIHAAFDQIDNYCDYVGRGEVFYESYRTERSGRSCATAAKALIVGAFLDGYGRDPRASEIATYSAGLQHAVILGADAKYRVGKMADGKMLAGFIEHGRAAAKAHEDYIRRGLRAAMATPSPMDD